MKQVKIPVPAEPKQHECDTFTLLRTVGNGDKVYQCQHGEAMYYDKRERKYY